MIIRPQHDSSCKKPIHRANVNPRAKLVEHHTGVYE